MPNDGRSVQEGLGLLQPSAQLDDPAQGLGYPGLLCLKQPGQVFSSTGIQGNAFTATLSLTILIYEFYLLDKNLLVFSKTLRTY